MAEPARRNAKYEDICALPDHVIGEILDGDLYVSPRPGPRHASSASALGAELNVAFQKKLGGPGGPGGWWILYEPELHLGSDVLVPDFAGWRRERMPKLPDEAFFSLAPDWVCEVVSPSTEQIDRVRKKRIYAREGVGHMWLANPLTQTLEVLRREGGLWQEIGLHGGNETIRAEPFGAIEIDLSRWWETG